LSYSQRKKLSRGQRKKAGTKQQMGPEGGAKMRRTEKSDTRRRANKGGTGTAAGLDSEIPKRNKRETSRR